MGVGRGVRGLRPGKPHAESTRAQMRPRMGRARNSDASRRKLASNAQERWKVEYPLNNRTLGTGEQLDPAGAVF